MEALDFKNEYIHLQSTELSEMGLVYGPVTSRRLGVSLGINLLGQNEKACSFNCPYCSLGATSIRLNQIKKDGFFTPLSEMTVKIAEGFRQLRASGVTPQTITFSGNGEPTLHPDFLEAVDLILRLRSENFPKAKVVALSNGAHLDQRKITVALNRLDERFIKLDAGGDKTFKAMNEPLARVTLARIIMGCRSLTDVTLQSFFVQGAVDNTKAADIEEWIEVVGMVKPKAVHIHGMNQIPAISGLIRVDEDTLYTIASKLERKTGLKALVFP
jgi:wyosine [tRNA(Phe)-imidazoG37] synthetase (radical SAM superfamily)